MSIDNGIIPEAADDFNRMRAKYLKQTSWVEEDSGIQERLEELAETQSPRKKNSRFVRPDKRSDLEREIRRILSAIKHNGFETETTVPRDYDISNSYYYLTKARDILVKAGWITYRPGFYDKGDKSKIIPARYYPTDRLKAMLARWDSYDDLKAPTAKESNNRVLKELNAFYAKHKFLGCCPPVLYRCFRTKDTDRLHGRLYAFGAKSFQKRKDRTAILIDGKPTGEVDIRCSQLFGFLALNKYDFTERIFDLPVERQDLYTINDLPREVVKSAVMRIMGAGSIDDMRNWFGFFKKKPEMIVGDFKKYKAPDVVDQIVEEYPILGTLTKEGSAEVTWRESCAVLETVLELMAMGIVALPTHDSVLVTTENVDTAKAILARNYRKQFGREPGFKVKSPSSLGSDGFFLRCAPEKMANADSADLEMALKGLLDSHVRGYKNVTKMDGSTSTIESLLPTTPSSPTLEVAKPIFVTRGKGRPRLHGTSAERQRAYRQRKKEMKEDK